MRIAMTGATSLLGRNLLFEVLRRDPEAVLILGRSTPTRSLGQRILELFEEEGVETPTKDVLQKIRCVDMDLDLPGLGMGTEDREFLSANPIDHFFHVAALTDFRDTPGVLSALEKTNVEGTRQILDLVAALRVATFCYLGSAYSCGRVAGVIAPDHFDLDQEFRNPYERSKLVAEGLVRRFGREAGCRIRVFRPSTICGALHDPPLGRTYKFDVFYAWAAFFLRMKLRDVCWSERYETPHRLPARVCYSTESGLNIIAADDAAKLMLEACLQDHADTSFHLAAPEETPHTMYVPLMTEAINLQGVEIVAAIPESVNRVEKLYYKTLGRIYTPYVTAPPMLFDVTNLEAIRRGAGIECPRINPERFRILMSYARSHDFGVPEPLEVQ